MALIFVQQPLPAVYKLPKEQFSKLKISLVKQQDHLIVLRYFQRMISLLYHVTLRSLYLIIIWFSF